LRVPRKTQDTRPPLDPIRMPSVTEIPGWEGRYGLDADGSVWSIPREYGGRKDGGKRLKTARGGRKLNYLRVHLTDRTTGRDFFAYVHHLAALTFLGPRPEGMEVLHGERGPLCNAPGNLRYGTPEENKEDQAVDAWNKLHPDAEPAPF
jgi:hypothetical protein